jgi:hypothetical protein
MNGPYPRFKIFYFYEELNGARREHIGIDTYRRATQPTAHFHRNPLGQKDIKLVDASIVFSDRLGSELITIRVLPDVVYPPDTPVPVTGKWPTNLFKPEEARLRTKVKFQQRYVKSQTIFYKSR